MLVDYVQHVAENSPNFILTEYGRTNKDRPLLLGFIGSEENLARLEEIRKNNLRRTGMLPGAPDPELDLAIVWLSFGVHGNEAAASEASMSALHQMVSSPEAQRYLENTIVLFDPSINPDGYSRYTHWYRNVSPNSPDPDPTAREHDEPWPGGRVNHYLFDLNRDWAWQTQVESQQRMAVYNSWMPHIHVDFHEQGYNSPYYFAPAARPYHRYITDWQAEFQVTIGKNHTKYFDQQGWLYFTKEVFDLFYPSYGDTYPTFNGAIGMTYEQAGGPGAGRAIRMENGDTLTLRDRIDHHTTTALSTVEVASDNAEELINNFGAYWRESRQNPPGAYRSFIISADNAPERLQAFMDLLDKNGIEYGSLGSSSSQPVFDYQLGSTADVGLQAGDLLITTDQAKAILTQVLLEPRSELEDSLTYDITAWALPYAYGLEAYASTTVLPQNDTFTLMDDASVPSTDAPYAYLIPWRGTANARFLAQALAMGLKARYAGERFEVAGQEYAPGTLVFTRADNRKNPNFDAQLQRIAATEKQPLTAVKTGFVTAGSDFGSSAYEFLEAPRVAVVSGDGVSTNSFGQVWHYFEQTLDYPLTIIEADEVARVDLSDFTTLIMPEGRYQLGDAEQEALGNWINGGGKLITIGSANRAFADRSGFSLKRFASKGAEAVEAQESQAERMEDRYAPYAGQTRRYISSYNPGAIFKVIVDNTHPLAYGLGDYYFSLKTNTLSYEPMKGGWNVGRLGQDLQISGFVGAKAREDLKDSLVFGVQNKGRGSITYLIDNPLYRGFWENGKFLFSNALFFVGQ